MLSSLKVFTASVLLFRASAQEQQSGSWPQSRLSADSTIWYQALSFPQEVQSIPQSQRAPEPKVIEPLYAGMSLKGMPSFFARAEKIMAEFEANFKLGKGQDELPQLLNDLQEECQVADSWAEDQLFSPSSPDPIRVAKFQVLHNQCEELLRLRGHASRMWRAAADKADNHTDEIVRQHYSSLGEKLQNELSADPYMKTAHAAVGQIETLELYCQTIEMFQDGILSNYFLLTNHLGLREHSLTPRVESLEYKLGLLTEALRYGGKFFRLGPESLPSLFGQVCDLADALQVRLSLVRLGSKAAEFLDGDACDEKSGAKIREILKEIQNTMLTDVNPNLEKSCRKRFRVYKGQLQDLLETASK